jgi:hypothetical protein
MLAALEALRMLVRTPNGRPTLNPRPFDDAWATAPRRAAAPVKPR